MRVSVYQRFGSHPHVQTLSETIPERRMLVFQPLDVDLLQLVLQKPPAELLKKVLKQALRGLAWLHKHNVVHNGEEHTVPDLS